MVAINAINEYNSNYPAGFFLPGTAGEGEGENGQFSICKPGNKHGQLIAFLYQPRRGRRC